MDNSKELEKFFRQNKLSKKNGNMVMFDASVSIRADDAGLVNGDAKVYIAIDNMSYGKVSIDGDSFDPEKVHTEYLINFQTYLCDPLTGNLVITGSSPLHGRYTVTIRP